MIFDTHAHYDDEAFDEDRDQILASMAEHDITRIVNVGSNMQTSRQTIELTKRYDFIYGAVGVHPSDVAELDEEKLQQLSTYSQEDKIVAIGEIGLDYHYEDTDKPLQKKWFEAQMELARNVKLPIIIHSRDAAKDTVDIMQAAHAEEIGGVVHCYSYSRELAKTFLDMDYYFGIGGVVTFKNAKKLKETVEYVPLEKLVLETDSPYLAPVPNRGTRNCSLNLPYVVAEIARIKGISEDEVKQVTFENAKKLYRMA